MKEFINVAHVTGIAAGQVIVGESNACTVSIKLCPPTYGICLCKRISKRIQLRGGQFTRIEDCRIRVESKSVRCSQSGKEIIIEYSICILYKDRYGHTKKVYQDGDVSFQEVQGNLSIDNVSVEISNPPRVESDYHGLRISAEVTVKY